MNTIPAADYAEAHASARMLGLVMIYTAAALMSCAACAALTLLWR